MSDTYVTLTGNVITEIRSSDFRGSAIASFRLASSVRRFDRGRGSWYDAETHFFTVTCYRMLAEHVTSSLGKGDPVLVHGRLRLRPWERDGKSGLTVEVEAISVGHDLARGISTFWRPKSEPVEQVSEQSVAEGLRRSVEFEHYVGSNGTVDIPFEPSERVSDSVPDARRPGDGPAMPTVSGDQPPAKPATQPAEAKPVRRPGARLNAKANGEIDGEQGKDLVRA